MRKTSIEIELVGMKGKKLNKYVETISGTEMTFVF